ncbi:hypothetical protein [Segniliparus rotundus]|uniref:hypothetical protein n=1 Tax=Segniliparus rotundus TaxID=286802 RepID=UPI001FE13B94|nr:hypothetical protein [Segniliparus rotundus]
MSTAQGVFPGVSVNGISPSLVFITAFTTSGSVGAAPFGGGATGLAGGATGVARKSHGKIGAVMVVGFAGADEALAGAMAVAWTELAASLEEVNGGATTSGAPR